jgi:hypothetical protein
VTGASAATVLGLQLATADDDVSVAIPEGPQVPRRAGIRLRRVRERRPGAEVLDGVRLAHPLRMAFDAAAGLPLPEATAALDGIVRQGLVDLAIEYDGRWHEGDLQRALDNGRLAALRAAGWPVIVVTAELLRDHRRLVAAVSAAVAERQALQP